MNDFEYVGTELELFARAIRWKSYFGGMFRPWLGAEVLEVGAGLGGTTALLTKGRKDLRRWVCLEPDPRLTSQLQKSMDESRLPAVCQIVEGDMTRLSADDRFDSILYIDVLEHIEDDAGELTRAAKHLKPGGRLLVLAPAHQWLFTPFDQAIGHYRRYSKQTLAAAAPASLQRVCLRYLDCVGLFASLANRLLLQSAMPSEKQILFWDRAMVPFSRIFDRLLMYSIGKSVLGAWERRLEN